MMPILPTMVWRELRREDGRPITINLLKVIVYMPSYSHSSKSDSVTYVVLEGYYDGGFIIDEPYETFDQRMKQLGIV